MAGNIVKITITSSTIDFVFSMSFIYVQAFIFFESAVKFCIILICIFTIIYCRSDSVLTVEKPHDMQKQKKDKIT